jgi:hypothetical protein
MTPPQKRTLSDWAMIVTVILSLLAWEFLNSNRLARVEQKVDDLIQFVKGSATSSQSSAR